MNGANGELLIEASEPRDGRFRVTASYGGNLLHCDRIDPSSAVARKRFSTHLADLVPALDCGEVDTQLLKLINIAPSEPATDDGRTRREKLLADFDHDVQRALSTTPVDVQADAVAMLESPKLIDLVVEDIRRIGVVGETELAVSIYLIGTSRLLEKPLAAIVMGHSSSGKSFTCDRTGRLFPDESIVRAHDLSPQSLFYLPVGSLLHRWVLAGERPRLQDEASAEATRALRQMLSDGELHKLVTLSMGGELTTARIWQPGPIAYTESTTSTTLFDEDQNRCLLLATDESAEQTKAILEATAGEAGSLAGESATHAAIVRRHNAAQRILKRVRVRVPFAAQLAAAMPKERPQARRAIHHMLSLIRAVAVLHQRQRASDDLEHGVTIDATLQDYVIARRLLSRPIARALGSELPAAAVNFAERLRGRWDASTFTSTQAAARDPILTSKAKVNQYLTTLADAGVAECVEPHRGSRPATWRLIADPDVTGAAWLPRTDMICGDDENSGSF